MLTIGCFFKIFNKVVHNTHHESLNTDFFMNSLHPKSISLTLMVSWFPSMFSCLKSWWKTPHSEQMLVVSMTCNIICCAVSFFKASFMELYETKQIHVREGPVHNHNVVICVTLSILNKARALIGHEHEADLHGEEKRKLLYK